MVLDADKATISVSASASVAHSYAYMYVCTSYGCVCVRIYVFFYSFFFLLFFNKIICYVKNFEFVCDACLYMCVYCARVCMCMCVVCVVLCICVCARNLYGTITNLYDDMRLFCSKKGGKQRREESQNIVE